VQRIVPALTDLGGFRVRRVLPAARCRMVGPWVFFDHLGPVDFAAGQGIDVRPHPHVNLATVTYLLEGELLHRDSLGSVQAIRPGDINLMVAGSGIVHSERERPEVRAVPHRQHGLQLWLALPAGDEETAPAFYHYPAHTIPALTVHGVPVRVLMGTAYGVTAPVRTFAQTLCVEARLQPGQRLALPAATQRAVYVLHGAVEAAAAVLPEYTLTVFVAREGITLTARSDAHILLVGGTSPGPRILDWNFVSSRRERIEQARQDWRAGRFPKVPGDEREFIPLP
jgi:redox-sensitive bicupin YhaK (pirin superfamily)